jgi:hypothetical protein
MSKISKSVTFIILAICFVSLLDSIIAHGDWIGWASACVGWLLVALYESKM